VVVAGQDNAPHTLPRKSAVYEQNMQSLQQIAAEDPRLVAMIVRGWMKKND
jgi:flagellar M-ring protein FliF